MQCDYKADNTQEISIIFFFFKFRLMSAAVVNGTLTLCMLGNFACFFVIFGFFLKLTFSKNIFQEYHQSSKQFGSRSGLPFCWA